jgi:hypothetical protein
MYRFGLSGMAGQVRLVQVAVLADSVEHGGAQICHRINRGGATLAGGRVPVVVRTVHDDQLRALSACAREMVRIPLRSHGNASNMVL